MSKKKYLILSIYILFVLLALIINRKKTSYYLAEEFKYLKNENIIDKLNRTDKDIFLEKGKIYVVNLWSVNCKPCIKEIPSLNKLSDTYFSDDIKFIAISQFKNDSADLTKLNINFKYKKYYNKPKLFDFLQSLNPDNKIVFPVTIIFNKQGGIEYYFQGYSENYIKVTEDYLSAK